MKKNKFKIVIITILLTIILVTISHAAYEDVTMTVVEEPKCTIEFGNNVFLERSICSKNVEKKEIVFQLKVTNSEEMLKPTGELILVIDNSDSMLEKINDKTREDLVINSAKTLITNLLQDNQKLKIGIVSFSTNSDTTKEGTSEDAKLVSELTNNTTKLLSAVSNIEYDGPRTNLEAGITLAQNTFSSENNNKYVIVLTDGVPNVAINNKDYYSQGVIDSTKSKLESLSSTDKDVIIMLTGISDGEKTAVPSTKTYNEIIKEIFGTIEKPTVGKFYYITDNQVEKTITQDIFNDLLPISQSYTNIKVKDYFTKEIVENFDFSYVTQPNIGTISEKIDINDNSITWSIPELKSGETAIVQYKLKLKEGYSSEILDKLLDTHSNLSLDYTDMSGKTNTQSSNITPKIKLTEPAPKPVSTPKQEQKPTIIPNAGMKNLAYIAVISLIVLISLITGIKYFSTKIK